MRFPKVGDIIATEEALELCKHFHLDYLIARIAANPDRYKSWDFDGCSGLPDEIMGFLSRLRGQTGADRQVQTYTFIICFITLYYFNCLVLLL